MQCWKYLKVIIGDVARNVSHIRDAFAVLQKSSERTAAAQNLNIGGNLLSHMQILSTSVERAIVAAKPPGAFRGLDGNVVAVFQPLTFDNFFGSNADNLIGSRSQYDQNNDIFVAGFFQLMKAQGSLLKRELFNLVHSTKVEYSTDVLIESLSTVLELKNPFILKDMKDRGKGWRRETCLIVELLRLVTIDDSFLTTVMKFISGVAPRYEQQEELGLQLSSFHSFAWVNHYIITLFRHMYDFISGRMNFERLLLQNIVWAVVDNDVAEDWKHTQAGHSLNLAAFKKDENLKQFLLPKKTTQRALGNLSSSPLMPKLKLSAGQKILLDILETINKYGYHPKLPRSGFSANKHLKTYLRRSEIPPYDSGKTLYTGGKKSITAVLLGLYKSNFNEKTLFKPCIDLMKPFVGNMNVVLRQTKVPHGGIDFDAKFIDDGFRDAFNGGYFFPLPATFLFSHFVTSFLEGKINTDSYADFVRHVNKYNTESVPRRLNDVGDDDGERKKPIRNPPVVSEVARVLSKKTFAEDPSVCCCYCFPCCAKESLLCIKAAIFNQCFFSSFSQLTVEEKMNFIRYMFSEGRVTSVGFEIGELKRLLTDAVNPKTKTKVPDAVVPILNVAKANMIANGKDALKTPAKAARAAVLQSDPASQSKNPSHSSDEDNEKKRHDSAGLMKRKRSSNGSKTKAAAKRGPTAAKRAKTTETQTPSAVRTRSQLAKQSESVSNSAKSVLQSSSKSKSSSTVTNDIEKEKSKADEGAIATDEVSEEKEESSDDGDSLKKDGKDDSEDDEDSDEDEEEDDDDGGKRSDGKDKDDDGNGGSVGGSDGNNEDSDVADPENGSDDGQGDEDDDDYHPNEGGEQEGDCLSFLKVDFNTSLSEECSIADSVESLSVVSSDASSEYSSFFPKFQSFTLRTRAGVCSLIQ